jgi:CDP-paratose 2-epimerase
MGRILVTGGAGFIGVNAAHHFAKAGWQVTVLDNLSRRGASINLEWLQGTVPFTFKEVDIRDRHHVNRVVGQTQPHVLLHLAAQTAVTTSLQNPVEDFEINAGGTLNLLEAIRRLSPESFFVYASTNKVYGRMEDVGVVEQDGRYAYGDLLEGVRENRPLDFHSPYGCSKGTADQYTIDYSRIYGLRTAAFRQSCIYGPHQFGMEDQGWVAWFAIAAVLGRPITIYGDGKQVRDVMHVDDLIRLYDLAIQRQEVIAGHAFNVGGGPANTLSLLELLTYLECELGKGISPTMAEWRPGDQKVFVSDITKAREQLAWSPTIPVKKGIRQLLVWVKENRDLLSSL